VLFHYAIVSVRASAEFSAALPEITAAVAGVLLLVGLWTPIAGILLALVELWIALGNSGDPWTSTTLATLGVTLAMIGPGAWSVDARLFGRKHIEMVDG
jgi:putative oxidoreductase